MWSEDVGQLVVVVAVVIAVDAVDGVVSIWLFDSRTKPTVGIAYNIRKCIHKCNKNIYLMNYQVLQEKNYIFFYLNSSFRKTCSFRKIFSSF